MAEMTIKDIAKMAGVSIATVSRVLHDSPQVTKKTKDKVNRVIAENDFYPNMSAQTLKSGDSKIVAFLIADEINEYYYQLIEILNKHLKDYGYSLVVCNSFNDPEIERNYLSLFSRKNVACMIINRCIGNEETIAKLSLSTPIVLLHRKIEGLGFRGDFVDADFGASTYELTKTLIENGHRKIAFISGDLELSSFKSRFMEFKRAMQENGIGNIEYIDYLCSGSANKSFGYASAVRCLSLADPPTAAVVCHNLISIGFLRFCKEHGIAIPGQLSVVCPCNLDLKDLYYVSVYSALPDIDKMGSTIARFVIDRIYVGKADCSEVTLPSSVEKGESVACILEGKSIF